MAHASSKCIETDLQIGSEKTSITHVLYCYDLCDSENTCVQFQWSGTDNKCILLKEKCHRYVGGTSYAIYERMENTFISLKKTSNQNTNVQDYWNAAGAGGRMPWSHEAEEFIAKHGKLFRPVKWIGARMIKSVSGNLEAIRVGGGTNDHVVGLGKGWVTKNNAKLDSTVEKYTQILIVEDICKWNKDIGVPKT